MQQRILRLCYLCGEPVEKDSDDDHVVPRQFIKRKQPKVKGFDYAGVLKTHRTCNNKFGGRSAETEVICQQALKLIQVLYNEDCIITREYKKDPSIRIMGINFECLSSFNETDLQFFGLIDVHDKEYDEWASPEFLKQHKSIDLFKKPVNVALSVLAKSAAAILVSRHGFWPKSKWRIMALPHISSDSDVDFDHFFGTTKPFEIGVKLWTKPWDNGDRFTAYKYEGVHVFLNFGYSQDNRNFEHITSAFPAASKLIFESERLIDMIGYDWTTNHFKK